jgi:transposase InsO family protein
MMPSTASVLSVFALAQELGNVGAACRIFGIHHSTYYRWRALVLRYGTELLPPRERRAPQMPNATSPMAEQRLLAYALAHPGQGPDPIAAELGREVGRHRPVTQRGVAGAAPPRAQHPGRPLGPGGRDAAARELPRPDIEPEPERHLEVDHPGTKGTVWQYTATDVYYAYTWAELHATARNPLARFTSELARRVARELAARGWQLEAATSDNGSEFRSTEFQSTLARLDIDHRFIHAGRPQTNGCVEGVQRTILDECWETRVRPLPHPQQTGLKRELETFLRYYNTDHAHNGRYPGAWRALARL